jgi:hypothetical protein
MAAEMAELYWLALTRDAAFREYAGHPLTKAASGDLRAIGSGELTTATLFRGETPGDRRGPFVSQFLLRDIHYGLKKIDQRFRIPIRGQSFLTTLDAWVTCQRGARPQSQLRLDDEPRYIASYRELVEFVHQDFSFQAFMDAALIILSIGDDTVLSPINSYAVHSADLATSRSAAKTFCRCWLKLRCSRKRRLTTTNGRCRIEVHLTGRKSYDLHPAILACAAWRGLNRCRAYGCCRKPTPRAAPRIRPIPPSMPGPAPPCSRRFSTRTLLLPILWRHA